MSAFEPLGLGLIGFGKMGKTVFDVAAERADVKIVNISSSKTLELPTRSLQARILEDLFDDPQMKVAVDFSSPKIFPLAVAYALQNRKPLICGTTGLSPNDFFTLANAGKHIPILHAANMSEDITLMRRNVRSTAKSLAKRRLRRAAKSIGELGKSGYKCHIHEIHRAGKADATSGTALMLAEDVYLASGRTMRATFSSDRVGDVAGIHNVTFTGESRMVFEHRARSRAEFAEGAIEAALWIAKKPPGLYRIEQVFGIIL